MNYLVFSYRGSSRDLKRAIIAILKSGLADDVKKMNYIQNFCLSDTNMDKVEEKIILIHTENQDKLLDFLSVKFPQFRRIIIA